MCKKSVQPLDRQCPTCKTDLSLLVDYVGHLQNGLEQAEALSTEARYFIDCIDRQETPFNDGASGLRVVKLLEAAERSLRERGRAISV